MRYFCDICLYVTIYSPHIRSFDVGTPYKVHVYVEVNPCTSDEWLSNFEVNKSKVKIISVRSTNVR